VTHYLCQELFLHPAAVKAWSGAISTLLRFIRNGKSAAQQQPAPFSFRKQKPALTLPCQCWLSSAVLLRFIFRFRLSRFVLLTFHLLSYHKIYTKLTQLLY
jgi:hypothetical protein